MWQPGLDPARRRSRSRVSPCSFTLQHLSSFFASLCLNSPGTPTPSDGNYQTFEKISLGLGVTGLQTSETWESSGASTLSIHDISCVRSDSSQNVPPIQYPRVSPLHSLLCPFRHIGLPSVAYIGSSLHHSSPQHTHLCSRHQP